MLNRSRLMAVIIATLLVFIAGCTRSSETMSTEDRGSDVARSDTTTADDGDASEDEEADESDEPDAEAKGKLEVTESGFANVPSTGDFDDPYASAAAIIHNPSDLVANSVETQLTLLDADGTIIKTATDTIATIMPGGTAAITMVEIDVENAADVQVQVRARSWEEPENEIGELEVDKVTIRPTDFGGADVNGVVRSTVGQDLEDVELTVVFRDAEGTPVGGEFSYIDFVPANGESPFTVSVFSGVPEDWTAEGYAAPSWLTLMD